MRVGRRAKWLVFRLDANWTMVLHLRMSGRVQVMARGSEPDKHTHLVLMLEHGQQLCFRDPRKFGRVRLLTPTEWLAFDATLGVEPLDAAFSPERLQNMLAQHRTAIKAFLLNQAYIAGLGNIYVDESLWHAAIHPKQPAHTLSDDAIPRLHRAIQQVLHRALGYGGSTLRDYRNGYGDPGYNQEYFAVYGRKGERCERCQTVIERIVVAQRGTHLCPYCQRLAG